MSALWRGLLTEHNGSSRFQEIRITFNDGVTMDYTFKQRMDYVALGFSYRF